MAHGHNSNEKVVYVGDSRVKKKATIRTFRRTTRLFRVNRRRLFRTSCLRNGWSVCVVLVGFLVWVIAEPAPLGYPADPTNAGIYTDAGLVLPVLVSIFEISICFARLYFARYTRYSGHYVRSTDACTIP